MVGNQIVTGEYSNPVTPKYQVDLSKKNARPFSGQDMMNLQQNNNVPMKAKNYYNNPYEGKENSYEPPRYQSRGERRGENSNQR